jgi:hypothetical protein
VGIALIAGLVMWTSAWIGSEPERESSAPAVAEESRATQATSSAAPAPIDRSEARAIFANLIRLRDRAFVDRDLDLADRIYAPGGPVGVLARKQIRLLLREDLLDRSRIRSLSVEVVAATEDEIRVRQTALVRQRYVADWGPIVSSEPRERQTVLWTLRSDVDGNWVIYDAVLEKSTKVR